jgi:hypothetical protein
MSDPGVVSSSPVSSHVFRPDRIIGQPPYSWSFAPSRIWSWVTVRRQESPTGSISHVILEVPSAFTSSSQSATFLWSDDVKNEGTSRITWEIQPVGDDSCRLTVTHDQMREGANEEIYGGWPMILSGLKTWLESGELLTTPGSLMYS